MTCNMENEEFLPKLGSDIINKKELIIELSSEEYIFNIQHKDIISSEVIIINVKKKNNEVEPSIYEKVMNLEDFKKLGKSFHLLYSLEKIFEFIINLVQKKEIYFKFVNNKNALIMLIESDKVGIEDSYFSEIVLIKRNCNSEELIINLRNKIKELEKKNYSHEELINNLTKKIDELELNNKLLKKENQKMKECVNEKKNYNNIELINILNKKINELEESNKLLKEENEKMKKYVNEFKPILNSNIISNLTLLAVVYGSFSMGKVINVTEKISTKLNDKGIISVNSYNSVCTDPIHGCLKHCLFVWKYNENYYWGFAHETRCTTIDLTKMIERQDSAVWTGAPLNGNKLCIYAGEDNADFFPLNLKYIDITSKLNQQNQIVVGNKDYNEVFSDISKNRRKFVLCIIINKNNGVDIYVSPENTSSTVGATGHNINENTIPIEKILTTNN